MTLKDVIVLFGVSDMAILNWGIGGKMPEADRMDKLNEFLQIVQPIE